MYRISCKEASNTSENMILFIMSDYDMIFQTWMNNRIIFKYFESFKLRTYFLDI